MNQLLRDLRGAAAAHGRLVAHTAGLTDAQARQRSLLPGWTVGHVLTHLARNAESHIRMLEAANRGQVVPQYPGGRDRRAADIAAGARRLAAELVADVGDTIERLEACWAAMTPEGWQGHGETADGVAPVNDLPFRRWRETEVHHADLGLGYGWAEWPEDYVRLELQRQTMLWDSRRPMGLTGLPAVALAVPEHVRLAWLLGRAEIHGLEPPGLMS